MLCPRVTIMEKLIVSIWFELKGKVQSVIMQIIIEHDRRPVLLHSLITAAKLNNSY